MLPHWLFLFFFTFCLTVSQVQAFESQYQFQLEPHVYGSPRGNEPYGQTIAQSRVERKDLNSIHRWDLSLHFGSELLGRRDMTFDLDRAWVTTPLGSSAESPTLTWGRIHPWDISHH